MLTGINTGSQQFQKRDGCRKEREEQITKEGLQGRKTKSVAVLSLDGAKDPFCRAEGSCPQPFMQYEKKI